MIFKFNGSDIQPSMLCTIESLGSCAASGIFSLSTAFYQRAQNGSLTALPWEQVTHPQLHALLKSAEVRVPLVKEFVANYIKGPRVFVDNVAGGRAEFQDNYWTCLKYMVKELEDNKDIYKVTVLKTSMFNNNGHGVWPVRVYLLIPSGVAIYKDSATLDTKHKEGLKTLLNKKETYIGARERRTLSSLLSS